MDITAEQVAHFLNTHPDFFEQHAEVLAGVRLRHPQNGHVISLFERQLMILRERNQKLEAKLHQFIEFANENEQLQSKIHEFVLALFAIPDLALFAELIPHLLADIFTIEQVQMRVWQLTPVSEEIQAWVNKQAQPWCNTQLASELHGWFGEHEAELASFAYLPLHAGSNHVGVLVFASKDAKHYHDKMGTLFLQRIADAVSAAIHPHLELS